MSEPQVVSYRELFRVPGFARISAGTLLGRFANGIFEIAMVLFVLTRFHSPALAGLTVFLAIFPGLLTSPIAGALLDRHGRIPLIVLDQFVASASIATVALLSLSGHLTPAIMLPLVAVGSLTGMLTAGGVRSLVPLMLPRHMWGRGNALDSSGQTLTSMAGPAAAGALFAFVGPEGALLAAAAVFAGAALSFIGIADPGVSATQQPLFRSALAALQYVWRNPSLRGMAASLSVANLGAGIALLAIPVLVLNRFHGTSVEVGLVRTVDGVGGFMAGLLYGRVYREGTEKKVMAAMLAVSALLTLGLAFVSSLPLVFVISALFGATYGPTDVSLFSLRQRRTSQAWMGRAMAVSMSMNFAGQPLGSGLGGPLIQWSLRGALVVGALLTYIGSLMMLRLVPSEDHPH